MKRRRTRASPRPTLLAGAVLAVLAAVLMGHVAYYLTQQPDMRAVVDRDLGEVRAGLDAEQGRLLESYGWIDRPNGVVRIPVEHAMELVVADAQRGRGAEEEQ